MKKLRKTFYQDKNVIKLARELPGKRLCAMIIEKYNSGIITETEASAGVTDKVSRAYGRRSMERTKIKLVPA